MSEQFQKLAEAYRDRIFTFALYSLRHREEAEDVTQEVLIRVWQNAERLDAERAGAWVMRVARNAVIDVTRRRKTRGAVFADSVEFETAVYLVANAPDAEKQMAAREFREAVQVALEGLGEPHRSIVIMREIQDMSYAEIEEALEMPLNTVRVYLHRGRRMLREELKGRFDNETA